MDKSAPNSDSESESAKSQPNSSELPLIYASDELFQGRREIWIEHEDLMYRIRITSKGKLYLTK